MKKRFPLITPDSGNLQLNNGEQLVTHIMNCSLKNTTIQPACSRPECLDIPAFSEHPTNCCRKPTQLDFPLHVML